MHDEGSHGGRFAWAAAVAVAALLAAAPAGAQALRGWAQVQYDNADRHFPSDRQESWLKSLEVNYATQLRRTTELASQLRFSDLTYAGRPDRYTRPEGMIRLAHPVFGLWTSYRPERTTDSRDVTTEQQTLQFSGYFQKAKLPQVTASWIRAHRDANSDAAGSASETRETTANYDRGILNLHASAGDQHAERDDLGSRDKVEDHVTLGSALRFRRRKSSATLQYDFGQIRSAPGRPAAQTSRVHTASANGVRQFTTRTSGSLNYTYRRIGGLGGAPAANEHNGALSIAHALSKVWQLTGGGGVRNALQNGRQETESYVVGTANAVAQVRPGWRATAGASHSWNWLPGEAARAVDALTTTTQMRLARGIDVSGDLGITAAGLPESRRDSTGTSTLVSLQTGASLRATPLPPVTFTGSLRHYGSGSSLGGNGTGSNSYRASVLWSPSAQLQATGSWGQTGVTNSHTSNETNWAATLQWTPTRALQLSGNYTRTTQPGVQGFAGLTARRETYGGRGVLAMARDLVMTVQYSEADPGLPSHRHQLTVTLTQAFRR